jgi:hypothetical protein
MRKVDLIQRTLPVADLYRSDPPEPFETGERQVKPALAQARDPHERRPAHPAVIAVEPVGVAKEPEISHLGREWQRGEDEIHYHAKYLGQERFRQVFSKLGRRRWWGRKVRARACGSGGYLPRNRMRALREEGIEAA